MSCASLFIGSVEVNKTLIANIPAARQRYSRQESALRTLMEQHYVIPAPGAQKELETGTCLSDLSVVKIAPLPQCLS